ncbi:MAG: bifunctional pyr operon transcriptional regulator/uracil phosphoribosyltransferase PyrR [Candidatus Altiarchaeota archaeon]|nr:bifunctional pyr operon transcriptional regulator/uracil phosphoribosyltransferase PyrR [Candidatus Altiarchaeota archaeon]
MAHKSQVMAEAEMKATLTRIAHEIVERNIGLKDVVFVGIITRGVPLARRLAKKINSIANVSIPVGILDVTTHRDDLAKAQVIEDETKIPFDIKNKKVILIDDVIFHGRTVRAAMDALIHHGRPQSIQLAVLIDRGHREFPIHPDYVGRQIPTSSKEAVKVRIKEVDGEDEVVVMAGE